MASWLIAIATNVDLCTIQSVPAIARESLTPEIDIRPMESGDAAFIFATWLNHLKSSGSYGKALARGVFFRSFHRTIQAVLLRENTKVFVATAKGARELIVGYLVTDSIRETPVVWFSFVKNAFRGHGIAGALWRASGLDGNDCIWGAPTEAEPWVRAKFPKIEVLDFFR